MFVLVSLQASRLHTTEGGRNRAGYEGDLRGFLITTCTFHAEVLTSGALTIDGRVSLGRFGKSQGESRNLWSRPRRTKLKEADVSESDLAPCPYSHRLPYDA